MRFAVCVVVLGGIYLTYTFTKPRAEVRTHSAASQLSIIRGLLNESLIYSSSLAQFKQSDPAAAGAFGQIAASYRSNSENLATAMGKSGMLLTSRQRETVNQIATSQKQALDRYNSSFSVVSQVLNYDPATDLGALPIDTKASDISVRASAAAKGLRNATAKQPSVQSAAGGLSVGSANDSTQMLSNDAQTVLTEEAACFDQLASQLDARQTEPARQTLAACINGYSKVRLAAVQGVRDYSFGPDYQQYIKQRLPGLLKELDASAQKKSER